MKNSTRNLLAVVAVLVVLGGIFAALKLTEKEPEPETSLPEDTAISLLSKQIEDVQSMKVTNEKGGFTIVPKTVEITNSSGASTSQTSYTVQGLEGLPLYETAAENVVKDGFSLVASKNLGDVSSLSEYGLEAPKAEVQVNFKDGTNFHYILGNEAAGSEGYYMSGKNSDNVYVVSVDEGIFGGTKDFVKKELYTLTNPSSGEETPAISNITLHSSYFGEQLQLTSGQDGVVYVSDGKQNVRVDEAQYSSLATAISTVTADQVVEINPSAEQRKQYGLDAPVMTLTFTAGGNQHTLKAGKEENGIRYIMADNVPAVFGLKEETAKVWAGTTLYTLRSKFVVIPNIVDVSGLDVTTGGNTYVFEKPRTKDTQKSTEDNEVYAYTVTCNGKGLTYDPNFQKYYQNIVAVQLLEEAHSDSDGVANALKTDPVYTVRFRFYDAAKKPVTVQYYAVSDRRYLAVVDGNAQGLVTEKNVLGLVEGTKTVAANGLVQSTL
ncbi:DUF4340 domain-containing protein [Clostridium minihomine]|uniref:DUF4340 domain-containing protein n=1 Tax=Clostridium minihomine TaxID=2045012 RepID=UPI000C781DCC|nr:DUF4340 domain-containing protein [Clostridium minihomine]